MKFDARRNFLVLLLALVAALGCRTFPYWGSPQQSPVDQAAPPVSQLAAPDESHSNQWDAGRAIYVGQCAKCHQPKPIQEIAIDDWKGKIIPGMSVKAKLTPEQTESLEDYIMAVKRSQLIGSGHAKTGPTVRPISAADNR